MSASVAVQTATKNDIRAILLQAITTRTDLLEDSVKEALGINESIEQVFVIKDDNTTEVRKITTGIQDLSNIEVTSGLSLGERVVTGPFLAISKTLKAGTLVKVEEEKNK